MLKWFKLKGLDLWPFLEMPKEIRKIGYLGGKERKMTMMMTIMTMMMMTVISCCEIDEIGNKEIHSDNKPSSNYLPSSSSYALWITKFDVVFDIWLCINFSDWYCSCLLINIVVASAILIAITLFSLLSWSAYSRLTEGKVFSLKISYSLLLTAAVTMFKCN